jgi:ABC-type dipeptide/oligopeptide/nickel transport system permease component
MLLTLFIIISLGFFVLRLMPGSVYDDPNLSTEIVAAMEAKAHLDKPIIVQYFYYWKGIIMDGDWGVSVKLEPSVPVFKVIRDRIPVTMTLNIASLLISIPLGIIAGTLATLKKSHLPDHIISLLVIICISVPSFVFASLLQYFLAGKAGLFPIVYQGTSGAVLKYTSIVLPVLALSFSPIATVTRYLRGELIETLSSEFMLLARTKGLSKYKAIARHAFRNSMVPLSNVVIPMFTHIMGGSLVVERIFSIPGVGGIMVNAVNASDHSLTMAALIFYSLISLITILLVDISYGIIDPRIRLGAKQ